MPILVGSQQTSLASGVLGTVIPNTEEVLKSSNFTTQSPAGLDTPMQIAFGAPVVLPEITIDADGTITANAAGLYPSNITLQLGRTGAANVSHLLYYVTLEYPSNPNVEILFGNVISRVLDGSDDDLPVDIFRLFQIPVAGIKIRMYLERDSSFNNSGSLETFTPTRNTPAGTVPVLTASPSASVTVSKFV